MEELIVGIVAIVVGIALAVRGYLAMRIVIAIWGAMAGFFLGAALVDAATDDGLLGSALGWVVAIALAVLFGMIAYAVYAIAVVLAMATIGFTLGVNAMVALDLTWSWAIVLIGVATGAVVAVIAIATDLPTLILIGLSALAGASVTVFGAMLLAGTVEVADFDAATTEELEDRGWWYVAFAAIAAVGIVEQIRHASRVAAPWREQWHATGYRYR